MDPESLRELSDEHVPQLTGWYSFFTRHRLKPEPEKSLILARDGSWRMQLEPCHPEDLPIQVEHLAERSITYGTDTDRNEAYWAADDTIREAYQLPLSQDKEGREEGFHGWLSNRLDLVRAGWRRLVEHSLALASRIGDPLGKLQAEDKARNARPAGERWSAIGRLEREIEAKEETTPAPRKAAQTRRGITR